MNYVTESEDQINFSFSETAKWFGKTLYYAGTAPCVVLSIAGLLAVFLGVGAGDFHTFLVQMVSYAPADPWGVEMSWAIYCLLLFTSGPVIAWRVLDSRCNRLIMKALGNQIFLLIQNALRRLNPSWGSEEGAGVTITIFGICILLLTPLVLHNSESSTSNVDVVQMVKAPKVVDVEPVASGALYLPNGEVLSGPIQVEEEGEWLKIRFKRDSE